MAKQTAQSESLSDTPTTPTDEDLPGDPNRPLGDVSWSELEDRNQGLSEEKDRIRAEQAEIQDELSDRRLRAKAETLSDDELLRLSQVIESRGISSGSKSASTEEG